MADKIAPAPEESVEEGYTARFMTRITQRTRTRFDKVCETHKIGHAAAVRIALDIIIPLLEEGRFKLTGNTAFEVRDGKVLVKAPRVRKAVRRV